MVSTPRHRRIEKAARLAREGRTRREIAEALTVTPRQVTRYLTAARAAGISTEPYVEPDVAPPAPPRRTGPVERDGGVRRLYLPKSERYPYGALALDAPALQEAIGLRGARTAERMAWYVEALRLAGRLICEADRPTHWVTFPDGLRERMYLVEGCKGADQVRRVCRGLRYDGARTRNVITGQLVDLPPFRGSRAQVILV